VLFLSRTCCTTCLLERGLLRKCKVEGSHCAMKSSDNNHKHNEISTDNIKTIDSPFLKMVDINKVFPGVQALKDFSISIKSGEVRALVGENGAGKSTLIKILAGVYQMSSGEIYLDGVKQNILTPSDGLNLGIVSVHQETNLQPYLSIAENIYIGRQPLTKWGYVDYRKMNDDAAKWLKELGMNIDPSIPLGAISIADKQMVAIARAVSIDARIMIFDEPTSSLTTAETSRLYEAIKILKQKNIVVIYISHRLEEIFQICDSLTVMRDGLHVATKDISEVNTEDIIQMMIGRNLSDMYKKTDTTIGEPVLEVQDLSVKGILKDISFNVRSGEIVGVSGLVGAGRTEMGRVIFGDLPMDSGKIFVNKKPLVSRSPLDSISAGIGFVPEDRKEEGLILTLQVMHNISMTLFSKISKLGIINSKKEKANAEYYVKKLSIKTPSIKQQVQFLSGGNQQRVVIAKWLGINPKVLIVDEPTRGIDVGAKAEIYSLLNELAKQGVGILMISSDLPEILAMSDRILVIHQGQLKAELSKEEATEKKVMGYATGQIA